MIHSADNLNGTISGRYQLQEKLGQGGMGSAYRALDRATGRVLALKLLDESSPKFGALFEREYHTLASLKHPCVIEVYDFGISEDGRRYYTMELLAGGDVSQLAPMPWRSVCEQLRDVATSLALLHARRLAHRDVSPRNVRIDASGRAKLLDFGTVTPFGRSTDVAGTPVCLAPEVVRGLEVDARADLFSLGVVAYWALSGRRPYLVQRLAEAEAAWRVAPQPLSELVQELPRALEQLVMSLLSVDAQGRPGSAAEVIERLVAIADLDDAPLEGLTHSHLSSCVLIGRERESAQFMRHFERAIAGQGSVVLVEGAAGMGKSRLTSEMTIQASMLGLTSLRLDALEHPEPSGLVYALVRVLTEVAPAEAAETLPAHPVLCQAFEHLRAIAAVSTPEATLPRDPLEQRALVHDALVKWLAEIAARRPLLVLVDNAHLADLASAAALIAIAHICQRTRMVFVAALLRDAPTSIAVQQLSRIGSRIRLRNLSEAAVEKLVHSVFGDVPHLARLTNWIQRISSGTPGQAIELLAELTKRGVIRYAGGAWVLPAELSEADLPTTLDAALANRLEQLSQDATRLARILALQHAPVALALCQRLVPDLSPRELFAALDELVSQQVLLGSRDTYRVRHERLRTLLMQGVSPEEIAQLHANLGGAILASLPEMVVTDVRRAASVRDLAQMLQAGWHLLHAGQGSRARLILRDTGFELAQRGDGFADAVPALQAALAEYERLGLSRYQRANLMVPLAMSGLYLDWRLAYKHGEPLVELYGETTGLSLAQRLRRWLGPQLALGVALAWAVLASKFPPRRTLARNFRDMVLMLIGVASPVIGNASALADGARAANVTRQLAALEWFPRKHLLRLVSQFYRALAECARGAYPASLMRARNVLEHLRSPLPGLPPDAHRQLEAGVLLCVGSLEVFRTDGSVHRTFEGLTRVGTWSARQSAAGIRANYHAGRGERAAYEVYREELDVFAAQSGSTWRQDVLLPRNDWWIAALSEDVLSLKRAARKLEQLAEEHPTLVGIRDVANASYLTERGRAAEALQRYESALQHESQQSSVFAIRHAAVYARVLRASGQPAAALRVCDAALARISVAEREFTLLVYDMQIEHALACAHLGDTARAAAELDALLDAQANHDNALVHGLCHKARAQVATLEHDANGFRRHLNAMENWFARTDNPALIAMHQRVADEGRRSGLLEAKSAAPTVRASRDLEQVRRAFLDRRGPAERLQLAVDLLTEKSGAAAGYLYLLEPRGLRYAAPAVGTEPPNDLLDELTACVAEQMGKPEESFAEDFARPDPLKTVVEGEEGRAELKAGANYSYVLLTLLRAKKVVIVGAVALAPGLEAIEAIERPFLEEVARGIYDAGDVQTVYFDCQDARPSTNVSNAPGRR